MPESEETMEKGASEPPGSKRKREEAASAQLQALALDFSDDEDARPSSPGTEGLSLCQLFSREWPHFCECHVITQTN